MDALQSVKLLFHLVRKGVVGGALVGPEGLGRVAGVLAVAVLGGLGAVEEREVGRWAAEALVLRNAAGISMSPRVRAAAST